MYCTCTRRKVPVLGKHSRKIHSGAWSINNVLALAGDDKTVTLSDRDGNTISQSDVKFDISKDSLMFSPDGSRVSYSFYMFMYIQALHVYVHILSITIYMHYIIHVCICSLCLLVVSH